MAPSGLQDCRRVELLPAWAGRRAHGAAPAPKGGPTQTPAGLLVARRHSAAAAPNAIGIVEPGCAWMLVSWVGSVRLMFTNALALPVICHSPAPAWLGATVDATPFGTEPKFSPESVATVIPTVTTTASAETVAAFCAVAAGAAATQRPRARIGSRRITESAPGPNHERPARAAPPTAPGPPGPCPQ